AAKASRRAAEVRPGARHLAALGATFRDVVPVRDPHASTLCDRLREGRVAPFDCGRRPLVALEPGPCLRVTDEPAQLLEQDSGGCTVPIERVDPLEPIDHCA